MIILGLETSCDETAAALVADGRVVLSNTIASQHDLHEEYAGVVPEIASRAHVEKIIPVVRHALADAGVGLGMVDAIAVGNRPGLIGSLLVGVSAAKALAWAMGKPLVGVDHVHAHLYSGALMIEPTSDRRDDHSPTGGRADVHAANIDFPALGLVVSGGHSASYLLHSWSRIERLGSTIDDAIGEAFDKAATILGVPYPGGPNLDRLASSPGSNDLAHEFPVSRIAPGSLDFSFSGLKTSLLYRVRGVPRRGVVDPAPPLTHEERRDLAASFQRAAVKAIILKLERAIAELGRRGTGPIRSLLTGGGVTANSRLRAELTEFARDQRLRLYLPAMDLCTDNAAMVAGLAFELVRAGRVSDLSLTAVSTTTI